MIKQQMERQLQVLKELDELLTRADIEGQTGTATAEDVDHLRKYTSDMQRACNTAIAIEAALKKPAKTEPAKEDADKEKPAKRKTRAKKAEKPAPEPDITEAAAESTEPEDDDLSFLD